MKKWGVFCMEQEVEQIKERISKRGLEIFEVRKLNYWEKLQYCKDPILFTNDPWIVMFEASSIQYYLLILKMKLTPVF